MHRHARPFARGDDIVRRCQGSVHNPPPGCSGGRARDPETYRLAQGVAGNVKIAVRLPPRLAAVQRERQRLAGLREIRLTRSDAEFVKSQTYVVSAGANGYGNIAAAGYTFSYQVVYCDPVLASCTAVLPDLGLQEVLLTVSGPNGSQQTLDFMKVQP